METQNTYTSVRFCVSVYALYVEKSSSNNTLIVYSAMIQFNLVYFTYQKNRPFAIY